MGGEARLNPACDWLGPKRAGIGSQRGTTPCVISERRVPLEGAGKQTKLLSNWLALSGGLKQQWGFALLQV